MLAGLEIYFLGLLSLAYLIKIGCLIFLFLSFISPTPKLNGWQLACATPILLQFMLLKMLNSAFDSFLNNGPIRFDFFILLSSSNHICNLALCSVVFVLCSMFVIWEFYRHILSLNVALDQLRSQLLEVPLKSYI